jgi:predicted nucleic acid-binding protein
MKIFLDTSSLIKLYHDETGTSELDKVFRDNSIQVVFLSDIARIEFNSAIWKKVRTKDLSEKEAMDVIDCFSEDYLKYTFIEVDESIILLARNLVSKYGLKGLRTLDSIQLASIVKLKEELSLTFSADDLLKTLIGLEGVKIG